MIAIVSRYSQPSCSQTVRPRVACRSATARNAAQMAFMPLGRAYGLDAIIARRFSGAAPRTTLPGWCYGVLRFQIGVVYTFAGVAKLTTDWLVHAQPLDIWLASRSGQPWLGPLLAHPWAPHLMSWAGFAFDLTIAGWLSWRRTRPYAFVAVVVFHALTRHLFPIGMFPFIMVAGATIFFDESWPRRWRRGALPTPEPRAAPAGAGEAKRGFALGAVAFGVYAAFQVLVPLRAFVFGGDVHWHEHGMRHSWRVMVREKNASVVYHVEDARGRVVEVSPRRYLDARQEREFGTQPDLVLQLAKHIAREWETRTGAPVRVRAEVLVSLNGRRSTLLVDPEVDLATASYGLGKPAWVLPEPGGSPPFLHRPRGYWISNSTP